MKNRFAVLDDHLVRAILTLREHPGKAVFGGLYESAAPIARALARSRRGNARINPAARLIATRLQALRTAKTIAFASADGWRVVSPGEPTAEMSISVQATPARGEPALAA